MIFNLLCWLNTCQVFVMSKSHLRLPLVLTEWSAGVAFEYRTQTDNSDFV